MKAHYKQCQTVYYNSWEGQDTENVTGFFLTPGSCSVVSTVNGQRCVGSPFSLRALLRQPCNTQHNGQPQPCL